ncbi:hypothetical protein [Streptomyces sp. NPDC006645]|uniref:hypothetical protein n=1 Tax=unclassified Streptomyces TaxID=2593676 RepID=UPI0033B13842
MRPPSSYGAGLRPILRILLVPLLLGLLATAVLADDDGSATTGAGQGPVEPLPTPSFTLDASGIPPVEDDPPAGDSAPAPEEQDDPAPPEAPPTDDAHTAPLNTCLSDTTEKGMYRSLPCRPGAYRLLARYGAGTSATACQGAGKVTVTYPDQLLCLRYEYSETAAYAEVGHCVYGRPSGGNWSLQKCSTGTFQVIGRHQTTDADACPDGPIRGERIYTGSERVANLVLCYQAVMPDDGYQVLLGECVLVESVAQNKALIHRSGCPSANAVVTGRLSYGQTERCGNDGNVSYPFPGWPELSYVVCWRYK